MADMVLPEELKDLDKLTAEQLLDLRVQTFTAAEVAPIFGVSAQTLRSWVKHDLVHIGVFDTKDGSEKGECRIFRPHLERFIQGMML